MILIRSILIYMYFVQVIEYYEQPDSLKCGKLMKISAKVKEDNKNWENILHYHACMQVGTSECSAIENVSSPVLTIYVKSDTTTSKCVIETNPKSYHLGR